MPLGREAPIRVAPDIGLDPQVVPFDLVDMDAARLALPVRARLSEPGGDRDDDAQLAAPGDLELVPLADRGLVYVTGEDQVGARGDEGRQNMVPPCYRLLAGAPRRTEQVMVQDDDLKRAVGGPAQTLFRARQLRSPKAAGLV